MLSGGFNNGFLKAIIVEALQKSEPGPWNITRHYMYSRLRGIFKAVDDPGKKCLTISLSTPFTRLLGLEKAVLTEADYPEFSLLSLPFPSGAYDFCISDQVIEHIEGNPFTAFEESVRVIKKGGYIAHTTCFMNEVHRMPKDFWRFTPDALRLMAEHCGTNIIECGGWGNKEVWSYIELGFRWASVPVDPSHPVYQLAMQNDDSVPIVSWVVAQKR